MSPHSQAKIFTNRIVLENGWVDFRPAGAARVEARGLMVAAAEAGTAGRVALHGTNLVQVASAKGMLRVYNPAGILVANVRPGRALDFDPQAGSSETKVAGCLMKKDGKWVVLDDTTQTLFELQGSGFEREWGNRVEVTGTAKLVGQPGAGSMQAIQVSNFKQVGTGGCLTAAAQTNSQLLSECAGGARGEPDVGTGRRAAAECHGAKVATWWWRSAAARSGDRAGGTRQPKLTILRSVAALALLSGAPATGPAAAQLIHRSRREMLADGGLHVVLAEPDSTGRCHARVRARHRVGHHPDRHRRGRAQGGSAGMPLAKLSAVLITHFHLTTSHLRSRDHELGCGRTRR